MNIQTQSWADLQVAQPIDPKSVIMGVSLGANAGSFTRSTNALQAAWVAPVANYTGSNTKVNSWDTTDAATGQDAIQWTFNHQMVNVAANIPGALNNVAFLRAGKIWDNQIEFALGGAANNNIQLTFRDNLGTTGQFLNSATGSVPVISLGNGLNGAQIMHVTFLQPGIFQMVLISQIGANWSAFPMEWIVLP